MNKIAIKSGRFVGYQGNGKTAPEGVFKLRYQVFMEKLRWIEENAAKLDRDSYDDNALIFYVLDSSKNKVVGTLRILDCDYKFMLENDFKTLVDLSSEYQKTEDSAEMSRLAVESLLAKEKAKVMEILFRMIHKWAKENKKKYFYFVTTIKYANKLKLNYRMVLNPMGQVAFTNENIPYQTFQLDILRSARLINQIKRYFFFLKRKFL